MDRSGLVVVKGTLELLVHQTLDSTCELHGFAILGWIRKATRDELVLDEGALYPAPHRMERRGWLAVRGAYRTRVGEPSTTGSRTPGRVALVKQQETGLAT